MDRERMKELADAQFIERASATTIVQGQEAADIQINDRSYRLVHNYRDAYDHQKMAARFSDFLEKYDYLVGDIAADQLRLRGFYKDGTDGVARNQQISALQDYLYEEVNFGAPFFVLENLEPHAVDDGEEQPHHRNRRRSNHRRSRSSKTQAATAAVQEKTTGTGNKKPNNGGKKPRQHANSQQANNKQHVKERPNQQAETKGKNRRRRFKIRERQQPTVATGKEKQ